MKVNNLKHNDSDYPAVLKDIPDAPKSLFWTGAAPSEWLSRPRVAIVGSRKVSAYGREVTEKLARELAGVGVVIISGLALGIDSIAHQAALEVHGTTIAILPTSLANIYPASHNNLAKRIIEQGGSLLSEYAPGSAAFKLNFIARNRIVSGLADILLITEAAANSGSLHTANFALEQGKTVMVVPGNITSPNSEGTNNLIKTGALPVTDVSDILFELNIKPAKTPKKVFRGTPEEETILAAVRTGTTSQEDLANDSGFDAATLARILTTLEIAGYIRPAGGGHWLST